ncbi:Pimeloyl-ACP methyl ester carboxylesterase [Pedococcus cremeus]|uniref:Pimeloyl-ACP methyl ester carboxylesterase n=1 Tax=Pedococcus cremeus TaxID=587636 RepID=A0A1H9XD11_9MICO|nr:alpha/beta hydrolase [Pedococcus cremeus]SES44035.1 Pimeloyl-ACP methyl ester carboxylesterase [Pedococcus cremeus]
MSGRNSPVAVHRFGRTDGPTLVLFHGNGDSGRCWPDAVSRWGRDYRLLAVDARGHGDSPRFTADELQRPAEVYLADARSVVENARADGEPVVGVGHSLGGGVLTELAARWPDLLDAAVLLDPPWDSPVVGPEPRPEVGERWVTLVKEWRADPEGALQEHELANLAWPDGESEAWLEAKMQVDLSLIAVGNGRSATAWHELVRAIRTPTLVVTGDHDCLVAEETQSRLAQIANPAVEVAVVADADHYVRQSAAEAFHAVVDPWIARQASHRPALTSGDASGSAGHPDADTGR